MMDINWTVRINNPIWWWQVFLAVFTPLLTYYGLNFKDLTGWNKVFKLLKDALCNPYILGVIVINVLNTINDPTTQGINDSARAMKYVFPN